MGDFHFVLRHALTGGVLILFMLNGLVIFHYNLAMQFIGWMTGEMGNITNFSAVIGLAASAPIIGVAIQGAHVAWLISRKKAFTDKARRLVAKRIRAIISKDNLTYLSEEEIAQFIKSFGKISADSIFVWLYHIDCPAHLVEWARRRRSYSYLGYNWAIAGIIGLAIGALINIVVNDGAILSETLKTPVLINKLGTQITIAIFSLGWIWGSFYLGTAMKRDVDSMELAWVYGRLHPVIKTLIERNVDKTLTTQ